MRPADKLQSKAATILPLVGLARSKQDPINRGHGVQYLYRPPAAGANIFDDYIDHTSTFRSPVVLFGHKAGHWGRSSTLMA